MEWPKDSLFGILNNIFMNINNVNELIKKVESFKKEHQLDLSSDEDLSIAIMNLASLEEHLFFTGAKLNKSYYYDLLMQVREMRKDLLKKIVKNGEGEVWCVSKHLLAASMRLIEVGEKYYNKGEKKEAEDFFKKAYDLYSLFWGINLGILDNGSNQKNNNEKKEVENKQGGEDKELMTKLNSLVQKLIDCCKE